MKRIAYFGTLGNNEAGHYFKTISGQFTHEEQRQIELLDGGNSDFDNMFCGKYQFKYFRYINYSGLAFPASPDDARGGSRTIVLVEDAEGLKDVLDAIENNPFLKSQFNRLCEKFGVQMPQN
ncbi:hypothetical protein [uncultured Parabacteroides sp.]|uniref:hypothetical protein n=1 Tax=uncultured Parabacteroides sp. TaxID=512312 RepID=UPI0025951DBC|nr:hypothetical protein [uncultured Parabacteroides sp.]